MRIAKLLLVSICLFSACRTSLVVGAERYPQRWVWVMTNLLVNEQRDRVIDLIERSAKAGYNKLGLADYKMNILERMPPGYFSNVAQVKAAADKNNIELVPCVFPIGRSDGLLRARSKPGRRDACGRFSLRCPRWRGRARPRPLHTQKRRLRGNAPDGNSFVGWGYQDEPGKLTVADHEVFHSGKASVRMSDLNKGEHPVARVIQKVAVRPHSLYRISSWVRTKDLQPTNYVMLANCEKGSLTFHEKYLPPTSDWTYTEVIFNSQDNAEVGIYAGQWGGATGTFWVDDLVLEELSLVNILRREGCPLVVTSPDHKITYREGEDFERVEDPKLGRIPYEGVYNFTHEPARIKLTGSSRIKNGDKLAVSWYHPVIVNSEEVSCCLTEPKVYDLLRDQAQRVNDLLKPKTFFMSHDEMRMANWCQRCQATHKTPGQLLADNIKKCTEILHEVAPDAKAVVWSDMFDPNHNAVKQFYLVNGSLEGSWEGLPPEVTVMNWNSGKGAKA